MRTMRTLVLTAVLVLGVAGPAAAQSTSTTMPPVRSIPVTPAPTTTAAAAATTTTAPKAAPAVASAAAPDVAVTGLSADKLVPFGLLLIGLGAALTNAARRFGRTRYNFL